MYLLDVASLYFCSIRWSNKHQLQMLCSYWCFGERQVKDETLACNTNDPLRLLHEATLSFYSRSVYKTSSSWYCIHTVLFDVSMKEKWIILNLCLQLPYCLQPDRGPHLGLGPAGKPGLDAVTPHMDGYGWLSVEADDDLPSCVPGLS